MVPRITLGTLNISPQGRKYVNEVLDSNRLSRGPFTEKFEKEFACLHQVKHATFMNSGTSALQVALAALKEVHGYKDGDEVLVPSTTFIATSNIVLLNKMTPIFVDVDPRTFNMDFKRIEEKITSRTRCIIPVHLFGLPADMEEILFIAEKHSLQVIEDSCETMCSGQNGKSVGSFGDLACFSTYIAHILVGGVGGLVTTNNDKLNEICRSLMSHGRDSIYTGGIDSDDFEDPELMKQMIERRYSFDRVGYSYRATELEAAIALSELERWEDNILTRRVNALFLSKMLNDLPQLQLPYTPGGMSHSYMMYPMVLKQGDRDALLMHLEKNGIETRLLFPLLSTPIYRRLFPRLASEYPVSEHLAKQGFFLGMHQNLKIADMQYISDVLHGYFDGK